MLSYENVRTAFFGYLINQPVTQVAWTGKIASFRTNLSCGFCVKPSDTAGHMVGGGGGGWSGAIPLVWSGKGRIRGNVIFGSC